MFNVKQNFLGGLNTDADVRFLKENEFLNLENFRIGVYGEGKSFRLENVPSPILKYSDYPSDNNLTIGRVCDYARLRVLWFNKSDTDDGIYAYDVQADVTYLVILSSQTQSGLNFSTAFRIDRNARIIGDSLLWTDDNNEPQCINIEAGIKLNQPSYPYSGTPYSTPIVYTDITLIRRPPIYILGVKKMTDVGFDNNFTGNNAYQFYYRYWSKDYQYSVLSAFSELIPLNSPTEDYNAIKISMPFSEIIDDRVQQVDICVRYGNFGKSFIIKSYNKDNFYDLLAIQSHNAGSVQLGFLFYDNITGIAIDDITANTSFDDVALKAKTIELARNRTFLANVLKGYNSPSQTSLSIVLGEEDASGGGGSLTSRWKYVLLQIRKMSDGTLTFTSPYYYAYLSTELTQVYFYASENDPIAPLSLHASDATASFPSESSFAYTYVYGHVTIPPGYAFTGVISINDGGANVSIIFDVGTTNPQFFKSSSQYQVTIAFYDRFRRKCGVVQSHPQISIPERTVDQTVFVTIINWTLNNSNTLVEIPDWAYYYQMHITKNLTTRFFVQPFATGSDYVLKAQDGTYTYGNSTFNSLTTYATAFDITSLFASGLGYTFTEGDYCRVYTSPSNLLQVIGQDGNFVFCSPVDLGTLNSSTGFLLELYTPYKQSLTEPFFETGDMMPIVNPTTINRMYSVTSGVIDGDCYDVVRPKGGGFEYFAEAMSPNDKFWQIWQTDRGWTNFIDTIGQQLKQTNIDDSDTYINGTKTNGLNKFQPLNTKDIGNNSGEIQKLQLTNKMQEAGDIMLVIATEQSLSAYLQEVQLYATASPDAIVTSDQIIGTINPMKNSFGTINPESVCEYNGTVWWFDAIHGVVAQYDANGVEPVSDYQTIRFWDKYGKRYLEQGKDAIQALCGFSYIDGCVDPSTREVMLILPQTETNAVVSGIPVGYAQPLPSYDNTLPIYTTSIQNRFDYYDGQPKIAVFKYEVNKWVGGYLWLPDCQECIGNKLYAWKNSNFYLLNENTESFNTFFGTQYPQRICFPSIGGMVNSIKQLMDVGVEGIEIPNYSVAYTEYPNEQITDLVQDDFTPKEGVQYSQWFKDRLSPNVDGTAIQKMYGGDDILSATPLIMCEFSIYNSKLVVNFIDIGMQDSKGHQQIIPKSK